MTPSVRTPSRFSAAQGRRWSLLVGAIALIVCTAAAPLEPAAFFRVYLAAYLFCLGIALGSMVLLFVYHLTGGSWGFVIRRLLEAGMKTLPLLALMFVPIAGGLRHLYPWAQPDLVAASPKLQYQQFYLAPSYFWIRAAVYFAVWLLIASRLSCWSREQDRTGDLRLAWKSRKLSGPAAVAYGITLHFAAIDWAMSLQPAFRSTIWGPLMASGQLLSAMAFAIIVLARLTARPPVSEAASRGVRNDLGSLLLTFLILWAYMAWFQFMLVWIANMPVDVIWYTPRASVVWKCVMWAIFVLHFVVPFFLLLLRRVKRSSAAMAWIAGLILLMQLVFIDYQVLPGGIEQGSAVWSILLRAGMIVLLPLGLGGLWLAYYLRQLDRQPLLPLHDDNRDAALRLVQLDNETARQEAIAYGQ
ncbi:MAG: hypothetical protein ABFC96_16185 [Thermoguttaceae bacterium]